MQKRLPISIRLLLIAILCDNALSTRSPFPLLIGGSQANTYMYAMDYVDAASALVVAGETSDPGIRSGFGSAG